MSDREQSRAAALLEGAGALLVVSLVALALVATRKVALAWEAREARKRG